MATIDLDGHLFVLKKDDTTWMARTKVLEDRIMVEFHVPNAPAEDDPDYRNWYGRIMELLDSTGAVIHEFRRVGPKNSYEEIHE